MLAADAFFVAAWRKAPGRSSDRGVLPCRLERAESPFARARDPPRPTAESPRIAAVTALIGGNKRLALSAFCGLNGPRLPLARDEAGDRLTMIRRSCAGGRAGRGGGPLRPRGAS